VVRAPTTAHESHGFEPAPVQKLSTTPSITSLVNGYPAFFGGREGDEEEEWHPHLSYIIPLNFSHCLPMVGCRPSS